MATLVSLHAHPDDESIATGGTLARASAEGHRVVLVFATKGEHGEVPDGFLASDETLGERREREVAASARALDVHRVEYLGYHDSGMMGEPTNDRPTCFWQAGVDRAAQLLAAVLVEEAADVLTVYDDHGGYGHPDHIQVHRVGHRAAELAGTPSVYEATMNRDHLRRVMEQVGDEAPDVGEDSDFGSPEAEITTTVDVTGWLDRKRASMAAHASQIAADSIFLTLPDDRFAAVFGHEWFIRARGLPANQADDWLLPPAPGDDQQLA